MRLLHPGVMLGSGVVMAAIGLWSLVGGDTFFGAFCLLIAGLSVPMALASASIRRRIRGDRQPLLERPVMRFGPLLLPGLAVNDRRRCSHAGLLRCVCRMISDEDRRLTGNSSEARPGSGKGPRVSE